MKRMNNIELLYLDADGLKKLDMEILKAQENLSQSIYNKGELLKSGETNRGVESSDYQSIRIEIEKYKAILKGLLDARKRVVIIEKTNEEGIVNIGDTIIVDLIFGEDDCEEIIFKLVASSGSLCDGDEEISINSPIGKAILNQPLGATVSYTVDNAVYKVLIKSKLELDQADSAPTRK